MELASGRRFSWAWCLRAATMLSFTIVAAALALHARAEPLVAHRELTEWRTTLPTARASLDVFFDGHVEGVLRSQDAARTDVYLETSLGRWRSEGETRFRLPIEPGDTINACLLRAPEGAPPVALDGVMISRRLLGGGWLLLAALLLAVGYAHSLVRHGTSGERLRRDGGIATAVLCALVLGSAGLELIYPRVQAAQSWYLYPPHFVRENHVFPDVMPGVHPGVTWFRINADGIRARERDPAHWDSTLTILSLGASTTANPFLDQGDHWSAVLERELHDAMQRDVWVGAAGRSGYSTARLVQVAESYVPRLRPRYVVLLTGFGEGVDPSGRFPGEATVEGEPTSLWARGESLLGGLAVVQLAGSTLFVRSATPLGGLPFVKDNLWYRAARQKNRVPVEQRVDRHWSDLDLTGFSASVRQIATIVGSSGARLVLCTHPTIYRADLSASEDELLWMLDRYTARSMRERMDVINERIRALARELGLPLVDLDRALPRSTETFYDDCHFNENGSRLVAGELMRFFRGETDLAARPPS